MPFPAYLLPHRVSIHPVQLSEDEDYAPARDFGDPWPGMRSVPARVVELDGRQIADYRKAGREVTALIDLDGSPPILPTDQIRWGQKVFMIDAIIPAYGPGGVIHHTVVECKARVG